MHYAAFYGRASVAPYGPATPCPVLTCAGLLPGYADIVERLYDYGEPRVRPIGCGDRRRTDAV
eukprot:1772807-Rhodomonas_salina.1